MSTQTQHTDDEMTVEEVLDIADALLNAPIERHEYDLPCGKIADQLFVTRTFAKLATMEWFGRGDTPFADNPGRHQEYLNSPDVIERAGEVTYETEDGNVSLPRILYFGEEIEFEDPIETDDPLVAVDRLSEELSAIMGHTVIVNVPLELSEHNSDSSVGGEN